MSKRPQNTFLKPSLYQNPVTYTMTPAALRARKPFFWKNITLATGLFGLTVGIYYYTLNRVTTDDFSDIPIPPMKEEDIAVLKAEYEKQKNK